MDAEHLAIHTAFDALAWASAAGLTWALSRKVKIAFPVDERQRGSYYAALVLSAGVGAYLFGTLNLIACGMPGLSRSIEGAILGAIFGVEVYKRFAGVTGRTGARFAAPLAIGVVVGRFGCFFSGIDDFTYGTPTRLPWGHDFGDGVMRHPAPLYESASMAVFLVVLSDRGAAREPLRDRQRPLSRRTLVRSPAFPLGIRQALRAGAGAVHCVSICYRCRSRSMRPSC